MLPLEVLWGVSQAKGNAMAIQSALLVPFGLGPCAMPKHPLEVFWAVKGQHKDRANTQGLNLCQ